MCLAPQYIHQIVIFIAIFSTVYHFYYVVAQTGQVVAGQLMAPPPSHYNRPPPKPMCEHVITFLATRLDVVIAFALMIVSIMLLYGIMKAIILMFFPFLIANAAFIVYQIVLFALAGYTAFHQFVAFKSTNNAKFYMETMETTHGAVFMMAAIVLRSVQEIFVFLGIRAMAALLEQKPESEETDGGDPAAGEALL